MATFACICKMDGTEVFQLALSKVTAKAHSATSNASVNLSSISKEYHNFPDVFNKEQASTLNPHRPYNLKIELKWTIPANRLCLLSLKLNSSSLMNSSTNT